MCSAEDDTIILVKWAELLFKEKYMKFQILSRNETS